MSPEQDFDSFRRAQAQLDSAGEQRIRDRFEELRAGDGDVGRIVALDDDTGDATERRRNRTTSRVLVGLAAALALVALVVTLSVASRDDDVALTEIAARAGAQPDVELPADAVLYQKIREGQRLATGEGAPSMFVYDIERWARRDGTGVERIDDSVIAEGPGDAPSHEPGVETTDVTEPGPFMRVMTYDELRALPADPQGLIDEAYEVVSDRLPADVASFLTGVLSLDVTPPAVRAAAFEALEAVGGRPMGEVTDGHGRTGVAFGDDTSDPTWMVVVDPATTDVLAFARRTGPPDAPITGADRWVEYLAQRIESQLPG